MVEFVMRVTNKQACDFPGTFSLLYIYIFIFFNSFYMCVYITSFIYTYSLFKYIYM